jgi:hypothetical protein
MLRVNAPATLAASAATDTTLRVWELPTGQSLFTTGVQFLFTTGRQFWVVADAQFTAEGSRLLTACDDGRVRFWDVRTGLLVNQTTLFGGNLRSLQIAPDDHHVLTTSPDAARVWEAPLYAAPAPAWLPRLAEGVAGRRLDAQRQFEPVPVRELLEVRQAIEQSSSTDPYTRWAKWFFADRSTRPQSPGALCTVAEHVQELVDQNTATSLRYALHFSPTNREAFARLARRLRAQNTSSNAALAAQADWCDHKAKEPPPR